MRGVDWRSGLDPVARATCARPPLGPLNCATDDARRILPRRRDRANRLAPPVADGRRAGRDPSARITSPAPPSPSASRTSGGPSPCSSSPSRPRPTAPVLESSASARGRPRARQPACRCRRAARGRRNTPASLVPPRRFRLARRRTPQPPSPARARPASSDDGSAHAPSERIRVGVCAGGSGAGPSFVATAPRGHVERGHLERRGCQRGRSASVRLSRRVVVQEVFLASPVRGKKFSYWEFLLLFPPLSSASSCCPSSSSFFLSRRGPEPRTSSTTPSPPPTTASSGRRRRAGGGGPAAPASPRAARSRFARPAESDGTRQ